MTRKIALRLASVLVAAVKEEAESLEQKAK